MTYPEHEKLQKVKDHSQAIGEFLEWVSWTKEYRLGEFVGNNDYTEFVPVNMNIQNLLAEYFEIDLKKLESEKREMLEKMRKIKNENSNIN